MYWVSFDCCNLLAWFSSTCSFLVRACHLKWLILWKATSVLTKAALSKL
jgi:hypothetical protein